MMRWTLPILAFALASCGTESVQNHSFSMKVDAPFVPGVNKVVGVRVDIDGESRDVGLLIASAKAIKTMAIDLNKGKSPVGDPFDKIYFTVYMPHTERNTEVNGKLIHVTFDRQELQQIAHFGADEDTILSAANEVGWWTPHNDDVIEAYCSHVPESVFCRKFVGYGGRPL